MRLAPLVLLCVFLAGPAAAAATPWQELAPGVRARLVSADTIRDGTTLVGLELDMPADTKTYWRVPGETGFPAEFDLSGSVGVEGHTINWPVPQRDLGDGYLDYVYYGAVVLPITLSVSGPGSLSANVTLGVCSDICVPATALFSLPLAFDRPDPGNGLRLAQAMAQVPVAWEGGPEPVGEAGYEAGKGLWLRIDAATLDPASLIVDAGPAGPLFGAPQKSPDTDLLLFPVAGNKENEGLVGKTLTITFATPAGAFEVARQVGERAAALTGT